MKFHGILHLVDDMLLHGVPMNMDTGSNESHHKLTKLLAKLTQRDISVFEAQTAQRLVEFLLLELAMEELNGKTMFEHFVTKREEEPELLEGKTEASTSSTLGGTWISVQHDSDEEDVTWNMGNGKSASWDTDLLQHLHDLQEELGLNLVVRTEHRRNGEVFRGHPNYRGKGAWNDWAVFDWGKGMANCQVKSGVSLIFTT